MNRFRWVAAVLLLGCFDAYCFVFQWSAVAGNTAAAVIWATPAFAAHHLLVRRRQDRHNAEQRGRAEAQAAQLAVVSEKVGELHDFHLHMKLPDREL